MKKALLFTVFFAFFTTFAFSQTDKFWSANIESASTIQKDKAVLRQSFPKTFKLFDLNLNAINQKLFNIIGTNNVGRSTVISLPNVNGIFEEFEVYEASNFDAALQAKFPMIRAFSGKGISDKGATLKLSIAPSGIQTMIFRTDKVSEFIEAYSKNHVTYAVFTSNREKGQTGWTCNTDDKELSTNVNSQIYNRPSSSDGTLKTIRLAQSCTGEYANYFGATTAGTPADQVIVLTAINATLTRCNGVYEKDLALHLNLVASSTTVLYYDPISDPYASVTNPNSPPASWNTSLQNSLTANIGESNYDIGHLFGASGGGGNAGCIGCVCVDGQKGRGITSPATGSINPSATFPPSGDDFDIDYVVHEIGHQLGALHTFSFDAAQIGSQSKEVGSGITIMAYAGIVAGLNVAPHSIDAYHATSIAQIQANLATKTCPITTSLASTNATPVVATVPNRTIPKSTPFILTGSATDANASDVLTYSWEQNDPATSASTGNASVASPTKLTGPNWLSYSPTTNPSRTCPKLSSVLAGAFTSGSLPGGNAILTEALSSVGRTLNFRLTVRDNANYIPLNKVAQTAFTDMIVTVDGNTGPFQVTSPNSVLSWFAGSSQNITWDVNGTTGAPINCSDVRISLSYDGGFTFPVILAPSTPNDGTEALTLPGTLSSTARIKIESIGNIFFDISNTNFNIIAPPTDFNFGTVNTTTSACPAAATMSVTIPTTQIGGFSNPITLTATAGVPTGTTVTFAPNPLAPGSSTVATLNNANTLIAGTYVVTVSGAATGVSTKTVNITFTITAGAGPILTTQPSASAVCAPTTATFTVATAAAAVNYQWQVAQAATPTTFVNITGATLPAFTTGATSAAMNGNVYRCIVATQCGTTTSNTAILTVNTAAAITAQPANVSVCTGGNATLTVVGTGTGVSYQWQSATTIGGIYTNVAGGTNPTLTVTNVQASTPLFYRVILTTVTCPGSVTSNIAAIAFSAVVAITTQPTAQTVCAGQPFTFTAAATGTGLTYQWQVSSPTVTTFTNIFGATNATFTGTANIGLIGNSYQVVCTGACNTVTSSVAALTVNTAAGIGATIPSPQTVCNGIVAAFNGSVIGTGVTAQWQSGPSATGPWTNIAGATNAAAYSTPATTPAMNGTFYRLLATTTTCAGTATSTPVLLTVNTVAVIGTQPTAQLACVPQTATFSVAATGTGLTYQWQMATAAAPTTFTDIAGATSTTFTTIPTVLTMNGNLYRVNILSTCSPSTPTTSVAALLTVNNPVSITAQPTNQSGCTADNYSFGVTAVSPGNTITYQWQVSSTGATGPYANLANAGIYGGVTTSTLAITNAPITINGNWYRVFISVPCGTGVSSSFSNAATIALSNKATVVLTKPAVSSTNAAVNTIITTTVSPFSVGATATYTWRKNGVILPNTLASTSIVIPVDDAGAYQVSIIDATTGCTALSNIITTDARTSDNLLTGKVFIYPNPASDRAIVRYNNSDATNRATTINVYDEKGARVITKAFSIAATNGRMELDLRTLALGSYIVYVIDASGKKLASGKLVKVQ